MQMPVLVGQWGMDNDSHLNSLYRLIHSNVLYIFDTKVHYLPTSWALLTIQIANALKSTKILHQDMPKFVCFHQYSRFYQCVSHRLKFRRYAEQEIHLKHWEQVILSFYAHRPIADHLFVSKTFKYILITFKIRFSLHIFLNAYNLIPGKIF